MSPCPFAKRFIGAENLPPRLSEFDVQQSFCLSTDDIAAVAERFRHERRVAAAIQMLFLRASGRPMDRWTDSRQCQKRCCVQFATRFSERAVRESGYVAAQQTVHAGV